MTTDDCRLIEDYLPLNVLNAIAGREKKHPKRYVELVHYWPARRPTTACRAAIYAALAAAPRTESERQETASFVARLASYQPEPGTVAEAHKRIKAQHGGSAPKVLDLFAGGGAIPLEAARLGCESHALDYNPVAYLIELCTLVYPQTFGPSLADDFQQWSDAVLARMQREIGDLYPPSRFHRPRKWPTRLCYSGERTLTVPVMPIPLPTSGRGLSLAGGRVATRPCPSSGKPGCARKAEPSPQCRESKMATGCVGRSCPVTPPVPWRRRRDRPDRVRLCA